MNKNMTKKLNRKGFTLIELLAVIVILAVIMVIATTSVLSSMNESKKKSLLNSARAAADAFTTNFSEQTLLNETKILGIDGLMEGTSEKPVVKAIPASTGKDYLDINGIDYKFKAGDIGTAQTVVVGDSIVSYNGSKFVVCLAANPNGSFYVASAKSSENVEPSGINGTKSTSTIKMNKGVMWACSNGENSWTEGQSESE